MNLDKLNNIFDNAIKEDKNYISVTVENLDDKTIECIIFNTHMFKAKQNYYNYAYNYDCTLSSYNHIKITGVDSYNEITMK